MRTIPRADLIALGGAPDAGYVVFHTDGSLYCCTTAKQARNDEDYWRAGGFEIRQVEGQP